VPILGNNRSAKESPFQNEGPTIVLYCIVLDSNIYIALLTV